MFCSCFLVFTKLQAQTTHFSEDFNSGQSTGFVANGYNGWIVTTPGLNGLYANEWFVTCAENGNTTGTCGSGCPIIGVPDETLHIGNIQGSPLSIFCFLGDCGAAYDAGLTTGEVITNKRAESPIIDLTCAINPVTISFKYIENGEGASDNFTLDYFDGITWTQIDDPGKTINNCAGQGRWTLYSFNLPASAASNPNVQIGFHWENDDNGNGSDPSVAVDSVRITSPQTALVANFSISPTVNPCVGDCLSFTDLSTGNIATWDWDFDGGGTPITYSGQNPPLICWNTVGTYNVKLAITDNCGNGASIIQTVTVSNCINPIAGFSTVSTTGCINDCFTFTDQSQNATAWGWGFPGGTPNFYVGQNPPQICYTTAGTYDVAQYVSDASGNTDTLIQVGYITITNCPPPVAGFTTPISSGCVSDCFTFSDQSQNATTWGWGFPGGSPAIFIGQNPPQICYSAAGVYDVAQYVTGVNGQTDTLIQVGYITINNCAPPTALFNVDATSGCENICVTFSDQSIGASSWSWSFAGGNPSTFSGQSPPAICYALPGNYDVQLIVSNAFGIDTLTQQSYITINVCSLTAQFSASDSLVCEGDCITLFNQSIGQGFPSGCKWIIPGAQPDTTSAVNPYVCFPNAGNYTVTLIAFDTTGADTAIYNAFIEVSSGTPVITNIDSATIYAGQSVQLDASGGVSYIWYQNIPINSLDNDSVSNPIATPNDTTVYQVIMIDADGCSSAKNIIINVIPPEFVWAPTAFTPNNDKINDVFYLKVNGIIVKYTMKIFTRWGEMIFATNDYGEGWNGTYHSVNLNVGVYIYYYKIEFVDGVILEKSGDITLLK